MATHKKYVWRNTKLSLHERFTMLRSQYQQHQMQQQQESIIDRVRGSMVDAQRQDSRNQRFLLQMERRPALLAALKIKQKSLRQRLGPNRVGLTGRAVDRLSLPARSPLGRPRGVRPLAVGLRGRAFRPQTQFSPARPLRTIGRTRQIARKIPQTNLTRGRSLLAMDNTPRFQTRPQFQNQNRPQFQTRRPLNRSQFQTKTQFQPQNQGRFQNPARNQNQPRSQNPNQFRQNQARTQNQPRSQNQNQFRQNNQNRNQFQTQRRGQNQPRSGRPGNTGPQNFKRGNRNFRGNQGNQNPRNQQGNRPQRGSFRRNQGRGRNGRPDAKPTKEELDLQLDQYMASTKSSLDKELDSYMNQSDT